MTYALRTKRTVRFLDRRRHAGGEPAVWPHKLAPVGPRLRQLTLLEALSARGDLSWLELGLASIEVTDELDNGEFTLLAPTDAAFERHLGDGLGPLLHEPEYAEQRFDLFEHLVIRGRAPARPVDAAGTSFVTLEGSSVRIERDHVVTERERTPILETLHCRNGLIHRIDSLVVPHAHLAYALARLSSTQN